MADVTTYTPSSEGPTPTSNEPADLLRPQWINFCYANYYLRLVNEVNGGDNFLFVRCGSVCMCVCAQRTGQSDQF